MRRLTLIIAAICLISGPLCAQSKHRGYNANGGWHMKAAAPARRAPAPKQKQPKNKIAKTPRTVVPARKS